MSSCAGSCSMCCPRGYTRSDISGCGIRPDVSTHPAPGSCCASTAPQRPALTHNQPRHRSKRLARRAVAIGRSNCASAPVVSNAASFVSPSFIQDRREGHDTYDDTSSSVRHSAIRVRQSRHGDVLREPTCTVALSTRSARPAGRIASPGASNGHPSHRHQCSMCGADRRQSRSPRLKIPLPSLTPRSIQQSFCVGFAPQKL
jgi:hypothetical protein